MAGETIVLEPDQVEGDSPCHSGPEFQNGLPDVVAFGGLRNALTGGRWVSAFLLSSPSIRRARGVNVKSPKSAR
jgi:hypothetical protein